MTIKQVKCAASVTGAPGVCRSQEESILPSLDPLWKGRIRDAAGALSQLLQEPKPCFRLFSERSKSATATHVDGVGCHQLLRDDGTQCSQVMASHRWIS